jgi:hypothetical protein
LTALYPLEMPINTENLWHESVHRMGDSATDLIDLPGSALAALLLLAGKSLLRRRALPAHRLTAHSNRSNCRF